MSFDKTTLNADNCPLRWREIAKYLKDNDTDQLNALHADHKEVLDWVYDSDYNDENSPAAPVVTVASKTATSITFNIGVADVSATALYEDDDTNVWDGATTPDAADDPNTDITGEVVGTLQNGTWEKTGLTAGNHYAFTFSAEDGNGEGSSSTDLEVVLEPDAISDLVVSDAGGSEADIAFTATPGANETLFYVTGDESDPAVIVAGTNAGAVSDGDDIATGAGTFSFVIASVNPGGTVYSNVQNNITIA